MPQYIQPTLQLVSNTHTASSLPGPFSFNLALNVADLLSVDLVEQRLIGCTTSQEKILDGSVITGLTTSGFDPGTIGCWIYMKNNAAVADTTHIVLVGIVNAGNSATPSAPNDTATTTTSLDNPTHQSFRTFSLNPGEFAFFPFDYIGDIYVEAEAGTPDLEYWRFDRG